MGSASHLLLCPHLLHSSPCSFCAGRWAPCFSYDKSRALLPQGLCTCCVCLSSSFCHSGLCSDVSFQKALYDIGILHWHPTLHPHNLLVCLSTLYIRVLLVCLLVYDLSSPTFSTRGELLMGGNLSTSLGAPHLLCSHLHCLCLSLAVLAQLLSSRRLFWGILSPRARQSHGQTCG